MTAELIVYCGGGIAGRLWLDGRRRFTFQYDKEWLASTGAMPLSLSLPLREEPFPDDLSRPFFGNLLPEADVRRAVARSLGISEGNDFALLEAIGGECAGAVSLVPSGTPLPSAGGYEEIDEKRLHEIVQSLPARPFLAGEKGVRLSLAGVQNKLPVYMEGDRFFLPLGSSVSSHIIKPAIRGLAGTIENEAFCMALAEKMGLPVPESRIHRGIDPLYLVERYDRSKDPGGEVVRLHQEDFCQALGVSADQKYESEGGPSLERCFALVREQSIRPAADVKALLGWVIFNYLIGNADAHAKNLSLLFTGRGITLAPFYDLLCTKVYEGLTDRLSMKIGGENRPDWIMERHWRRLAESASVKEKLLLETLKSMAIMIAGRSEKLSEEFETLYGKNDLFGRIMEVINARSRKATGAIGLE